MKRFIQFVFTLSLVATFSIAQAQVAEWTWEGGPNTTDQWGTHGTLGISSASSIPGARDQAVTWTDSNGNLWMFGGGGYDNDGTLSYLNDLWMFDGTNWTWMSGSNGSDQIGNYGTIGVTSATNIPGARWNATSWIDNNNNLWLFGGYGYANSASAGTLNDLWKFDGTNWTWVSGSNTTLQAGVYGSQGVSAATNVPGARSGAIGWIDSNNNMYLFGGNGRDINGSDDSYLNDLWRYDGSNWTWISGSNTVDQFASYGSQGVSSASNVPGARWNAAGWIDNGNNIWLFGGYGQDASLAGNLSDLWRFDGSNWTWVKGSNSVDQSGTYGSLGTPEAANFPGGRWDPITWTDSNSDLWMYGGRGYASGEFGNLSDLWRFDGNDWIWVSGDNTVNNGSNYGSLGVGSPSNTPGGRLRAASWVDGSGDFWFFGGSNYDDVNGYWVRYSDVWHLTISDYAGCSGSTTVTSLSGTITDGSGPNNYNNGLSCQWLLSPAISDGTIDISFTQFDLESCCDYVRIYDGPTTSASLLLEANGTSIPNAISSSGPEVLITFNTDGSVTAGGWELNYTANDTGSATCSGTTYITDISGTINDGSGTLEYSNDLSCEWLLQPAITEGTINISFTQFELEDCCDYVRVYDGPTTSSTLLLEANGFSLPSSITSSGKEVLVTFTTDGSVTYGGWEFNFVATETSSGGCSGSTTITDISGTVSDGSGADNYVNNLNCEWLLQPAINEGTININFTQFELEDCCDYVRIYDGPTTSSNLLLEANGFSIPSSITSSGKEVLVTFTTDGSVTYGGWEFNYVANETSSGGCSGSTTITALSGTITDGSGSQDYANDLSCQWLLSPSIGSGNIDISFTQFELEDCCDYVRIYDGPTTSSTLLLEANGTTLPSNISSSGNQVLITFTTDGSVTYGGWSLNYTANESYLNILSENFPSTVDNNTNLEVSIQVDYPEYVTSAMFYYRGISDDTDNNILQSTASLTGTNTYSVSVPINSSIDPVGVEYFFLLNGFVESSVGSTVINYSDNTSNTVPNLVFGDQIDDYQIIAIPFELDNSSVTSVFDELYSEHGYDTRYWRLFSYSNGVQQEYPSFSSIQPGKGYWFISRESTTIYPGSGSAVRVTKSDPFTMNLSSGWNLIGNPYNFSISWTDILEYNGYPSDIDGLITYSGGTLTYNDVLSRYRGGFVYNYSSSMNIDIPVERNTSIGGRIEATEKVSSDIGNDHWEINLHVSNGDLRNELAIIGMRPEASSGFDNYDRNQIPIVQESGFIAIDFIKDQHILSKEIAQRQEEYSWEVNVNMGLSEDQATLEWDNSLFGDNTYELYLVNTSTMKYVDMRKTNSIDVNAAANKFKILYGSMDYINSELLDILPAIGEPYPNPTSSTITIPVKVSNDDEIRFSVYDNTGRLIKEFEGNYTTGIHNLNWEFEKTGIYFAKIQLNEYTTVKKIIVK